MTTASRDRRHVLVVAGPTASGKSGLAMDIAEACGGDVINADSMQVYRELRIVTARPSVEDETRVPHRLYGDIAAADGYSVGDWLDGATAAIEDAFANGRLPVIVGGTGLYLKALLEGLAPVPEVDHSVRDAVTRRYDELGGEAFHERLLAVDPATAARLTAADRQRLTRAMEIYEATGRSMSAWLADGNHPALADARFHELVLVPPRDELYATIDRRFESMVEAGAVAEVEGLLALGLDPARPAMKAVGVREIGRYLAGEQSLDRSIAQAQQASRNYAKRQTTWFKNQLNAEKAIFAQYMKSHGHEIFAFIRQFWLTGPA